MSSSTENIPRPVSVLIVEDDPVCRETFANAVRASPHLRLAGVATDLPDGLERLAATEPDVLLVDIGLPSGSGLALIHYAERYLPQCDVMVVSVFADESLVLKCIKAGATGYLLKDSEEVDIARQICLLRDGGSPITPSIARRLLVSLGGPRESGNTDASEGITLSAQERTVLQLCAKGYTYEEVSQLLSLSRHTVETYVKRVYRKLQVHSRSEAVFEARKLGLMDD